MDTQTFLRELQYTLEKPAGCSTKTTPAKGAGFTFRNRHGYKWGQADELQTGKIRLVFDLRPEGLNLAEFRERTNFDETPKRTTVPGYRHKAESEMEQLTVYMDDSYLQQHPAVADRVLEYAEIFAGESEFKIKSSGP